MGLYTDLMKNQAKKPQRATKKARKPQSTSQSTNRPIDRPTDQSVDPFTLGPIVDRPKAFYITKQVDVWLDEAVRKLQSRGVHKADRSVLVNAILHEASLYTEKSLEKLRNRVVAHLTNKGLSKSD